MKHLVLTICAFGLLGAGLRLYSQTTAGQSRVQVVEQQVEVDGKPNESLKDLELRALNEARRALIEKANGVFVTSRTVLNNARVLMDLVSASSDGLLLNPEVLESSPIVQGQSIHWKVRLRASVTPPRIIRQDPNFKVRVKLDSEILRPGDALHLTLSTTMDAYIHVFDIYADNTATVLLPNRYHRDKFVKANTDLRFPSAAEEQQGISLRASLPNNLNDTAETIVVIATKRDVDLISTDFQEAILKDFDPNNAGVFNQLALKLFNLPDSEWVESVATYRIIRDRAR